MKHTAAPQPGYRVVSLRQLAAGGRWRTEAMRSYGQPLLYWFTRGQGRITVQGVTRGWGPHNAVYLPGDTMHGFEVTGTVGGYALHFTQGDAATLPDSALHLRLRDAASQGEMNIQVENIRREIELGDAASARALANHASLLGVWMDRHAETALDAAADPPRAAESLTEAYVALVERHYREGRSVASYAARLGVTATHLSRCCKQTSGRTASGLLHDRVTFEARRLLGETDLPVKEVAQRLGFTSAAYFTRAFQARSGLTPTGFRRRK
ncbi:AraC family transcriptional regulator [Palleronia sediminis]|uniref:AraC family transcriptional regulator n=1 Tax=Palleronia sediminis TaxID=2547833 RepID=A0A4V3BAK6_9RHOB|nr:AraC family transcriptional regulator [Palleronia sediminis]TDL83549.1 AraC family transcriptional regulator [Palleronia sediminis]